MVILYIISDRHFEEKKDNPTRLGIQDLDEKIRIHIPGAVGPKAC